MADAALIGSGPAITFMVSAGLVYEIIAAACSSPQTAEINADRRSGTLMKWVRLGLAQAALFVLIAAAVARGKAERLAAVAGGALAAVLMWWQYAYAMRCGLRSAAPGTEG